ncbi:MAG: hypothetical protein ACYTE8_01445 [Planctomycetota bacterium]|jgi:hypothetical protein
MNKQQIIEELIALLDADGVAIRREELGGSGGGLCFLKGQMVFFLDTQSSDAETATRCAEAVLKRVDIEKVFIKPEVREFVEQQIIVE